MTTTHPGYEPRLPGPRADSTWGLNTGRRPRPSGGGGGGGGSNPYRHKGGRTYQLAYGTALAVVTLIATTHRHEISDVWSAVVRWARSSRTTT